MKYLYIIEAEPKLSAPKERECRAGVAAAATAAPVGALGSGRHVAARGCFPRDEASGNCTSNTSCTA